MTERRILVVDDQAVAKVPLVEALGSVVDWCPDVDHLAQRLAAGERWDAAFIDFYLGLNKASGLNAMMRLRRADPGIRLVSLSSYGDGGGRMLFIAAAHHWYDAVFMNKADLDPELVRRAVDPADDPTDPRLLRQLSRAHIVDNLFAKPSWLPIWLAWPCFDGSHAAISSALGATFTPSVLREFAERAAIAIHDFETHFATSNQLSDRRWRTPNDVIPRKKQAQAVPIARFATENRIVFASPALDEVIRDINPAGHRH